MRPGQRPLTAVASAVLAVLGAVVLLIGSGTTAAAVVAPAPEPAAAPASPAPTAATAPTAALVLVGPAWPGWSWPLAPRPAVLAGFDPPSAAWGSGHRGVDLAAAVGQEVLAPSAGLVVFSGVVVDRGVVVVATPSGLRSTLEPVDPGAPVGANVAPGQVVGHVTATPGHCAPITCLHWGVLRGSVYLDPLALVGRRPVVLLPLPP